MSHPAPTSPPKKRIIICCDGTWQTSAHGTHSIPSNIAKLSRSLSPWYFDPESSQWAPQVVYYDAGVGTGVSRVEKKYAGAFGLGLDENVCEAYNFLVNNYVEGDDLFFFGFSRGAYTVRATAGLVCRVGICRTDMMDKFWEMWAAYRSCGSGTDLGKTEWGRELREGEASSALPLEYPPGHPVKDEEGKQIVLQTGAGAEWLGKCVRRIKIKVVGVFDTVGSLGYPDTALGILKNQNPSGFHDTGVHPHVENAFHALALEEHRKPFSPTLWCLPDGSTTNLIQCWFPGVHINVGGGSDDGLKAKKGDLEGMANITFAWMVDRCAPFLKFEHLNGIMNAYADGALCLTNPAHNHKRECSPEEKELHAGWGTGPIADSYEGIMNTAGGEETRRPGAYFEGQKTNEYIHPVVHHVWQRSRDQNEKNKSVKVYKPEVLDGFNPKETGKDGKKIWVWTKTYEPHSEGWVEWARHKAQNKAVWSHDKPLVVTLEEFPIPQQINFDGLDINGAERLLVREAAKSAARRAFLTKGAGKTEDEFVEEYIKNDAGMMFLTQRDG